MPSAYFLSYHFAQLPEVIILTTISVWAQYIFVKLNNYDSKILLLQWFLTFLKLNAVLTMTII